MQLILVRHGETDWNREGRYQGNADVTLNEAGLRQAKDIRRRLRGMKPSVLFSSNLRRALMTAAELEKEFSLPVGLDSRLREVSFGCLEGKDYASLDAEGKELCDNWFTNPSHVCLPGGEDFSDFKARVLSFRDDILTRFPGETIIAVTHGGPARLIIADTLGMPQTKISRLQINPGSINIVQFYEHEAYLKQLNG